MINFKVAVAAAFLVVAYFMVRTVRHGRKCAERLAWLEKPAFERSLARHKRLANRTVIAAVIAVIVTETMVRFRGGVVINKLFLVHLSCSLPFLLSLLALRLWLTGLKNPDWHRRLAYLSLAFMLLTLSTGAVLLIQLEDN